MSVPSVCFLPQFRFPFRSSRYSRDAVSSIRAASVSASAAGLHASRQATTTAVCALIQAFAMAGHGERLKRRPRGRFRRQLARPHDFL
jgi:hypothetical protein